MAVRPPVGAIRTYTSTTPGVTIVELTRPEKANALRVQDKVAVAETIKALGTEPDVRAVVISGAGGRSFCAGSDIREMMEFGPDEMFAMLGAERAMYRAVLESPKPIVAAVNGNALGAGMILAMSCDYVVASESARFGTPELTIGVAAPLEGFLLPWIVGLGKARAIFYMGQALPATEAMSAGIAHEIVLTDDCLTRAVDVAGRIAGLPGDAFRIQKRLLSLLIDTGVATAPGVDFDPVDGRRFVRLSFAVSTPEVEEALRRLAPWFEARGAITA